MKFRPAAAVLVVVMLLAQGRLLACGVECMGEVAVAAEASCHTESAPAVALSSGAAHACLPEVAEPPVTVAKTVKAQTLVAAPLVPAFLMHDPPAADARDRRRPRHLRFAPPQSPAPTILRI
ncbi:MAG: hypothetical protein AB7N29_20635 [Vicinamibacterales bacterium]